MLARNPCKFAMNFRVAHWYRTPRGATKHPKPWDCVGCIGEVIGNAGDRRRRNYQSKFIHGFTYRCLFKAFIRIKSSSEAFPQAGKVFQGSGAATKQDFVKSRSTANDDAGDVDFEHRLFLQREALKEVRLKRASSLLTL